MATNFPVTVSDNLGATDLLTRGYTARPSAQSASGRVNVNLASALMNDGLLVYRVLWPNNTTGVVIKSTMGQIKWMHLYNNAGSARFVKLYDKATAPVVGSDKPVLTIGLAANSARDLLINDALQFVNGIGIGVSTGITDSDTTAPSANDCAINIGYL